MTGPERSEHGPTVRDLVLARAGDHRTGLIFEDRTWTWDEVVTQAHRWADLLMSYRRPGPFHIGTLLDTTPEHIFLLCGAALCGATVVGLNATRSPAGLARDARRADCQVVVTEPALQPRLDGIDLGVPVLDATRIDIPDHPAGSAPPVRPDSLYLLLFTSGTSGEPKAVRCSQGAIVRRGNKVADRVSLGPEDTAYICMPLFHSNAIIAGFAPALVAGAALALRRSFSASGFLADVRRFGATYANYVGKPLSYILAQPERPDDADSTLRAVFGNEAAARDIVAFGRRFDCLVFDHYGQTEGGLTLARDPGDPPGAMGRGSGGERVVDPVTGRECPPARIENGRISNADECIGELVNTGGLGSFEGYYDDPEAERERTRNGWYWTGDLAFRDEQGRFYFAGRRGDWARVDGENMALAGIELVLQRHPDVVNLAVYPVPDPAAGDQLMVALHWRADRPFDPAAFERWLREQPDLGPKGIPRFVRLTRALPMTATNKVRKRVLVAERWEVDDPVWWRPRAADGFCRFDASARAEWNMLFERHGRAVALDLAGSGYGGES
ncbi:long-chain-fatty-acid--CoA ligase [Dactylosporangium fulvum]|uniref:AMP-binding protein n=1 Tax=Dactylosporangium fulvum TaxID=53359 RepID=A0ABY5W8I6_9ACTN|nr:AMP-binding protein [Dactylosporangium fulvum]UWP85626.1 AMP-binding protein [Dactylosporangium fulvum]